MTNTVFTADLHNLLRLHDVLISRQMDAAACGTSSDYRRAREAEAIYEQKLSEFEESIQKEGVDRVGDFE